ncbi:MAG: glycosyltransferase family 2 protein [Chitinophagales bacterium]
MKPISIVIICKNEADIIGTTLQSIQGLTDDIIVYDNGSSDNTMEIARRLNAKVQQGNWEGYGKTKNKANLLAGYDWILSLDADEAIDDELKNCLLQLELNDENAVFELKFKNFLGNKHLRYGEWGRDKHIRLFNRKKVSWNDSGVHEQLLLPENVQVKKTTGYVLHRTMKDIADYSNKMLRYAMLNAEKYFRQGKKSSWFKIKIAPAFTFTGHYIFKLGFLDGYAGYICARMTAYYTFLKYARLKELWKEEQKRKNR